MSRIYENANNVMVDYLADIRSELTSANQTLVRLLEALQALAPVEEKPRCQTK